MNRVRSKPEYPWIRILLVCGVALAFLWPKPINAQQPVNREYQIKAVFLFNFTKFIEWPGSAFPPNSTTIRIGVLGKDPFGSTLDETVRGETIGNRQLVVKRSQRIEDLLDCHLIFISKSEKDRVPKILSDLGPRAVLTVSETAGFARQGGIINFYLEGNKVRFEINQITARRIGLKISSQLLSVGKIVEPESASLGGDP